MSEKDLSINKICHRAEMQRGQLNKYRHNDLNYMDIDVLARLCEALECGIGDILEYVPPKSSDSEK